MSERPSPVELLERPGALLTTTDLAALGLPRKAIEAVLRSVEPVYLPGYRRPLVRREDYLELVERSQHRGDQVRPAEAQCVCAGYTGARGRPLTTTSPRTCQPTCLEAE